MCPIQVGGSCLSRADSRSAFGGCHIAVLPCTSERSTKQSELCKRHFTAATTGPVALWYRAPVVVDFQILTCRQDGQSSFA